MFLTVNLACEDTDMYFYKSLFSQAKKYVRYLEINFQKETFSQFKEIDFEREQSQISKQIHLGTSAMSWPQPDPEETDLSLSS